MAGPMRSGDVGGEEEERAGSDVCHRVEVQSRRR